MPKLDDLNFDSKAAPAVDMEKLPEEWGDFAPPPYPGAYTMQLPHELSFEIFKAKVPGGKEEEERVRAVFDAAHPFMVVATTPENADEIGKLITFYTVSNAEYERTHKGEKVLVSEMAYLLKGGLEVSMPKGALNAAWATALNEKAGELFGCEVEWEAYCNPDKKRWLVDLETDKRTEDTQAGCGRRYNQKGYTKGDGEIVHDIPKEVGTEVDAAGNPIGEFYAEDFSCICGESNDPAILPVHVQIRCRPRLRRYGPVILKPAAAPTPPTA